MREETTEADGIVFPVDVASFLRRAHYHLMDDPHFWSRRELLGASKILCVNASDIQAGFERPGRWWESSERTA